MNFWPETLTNAVELGGAGGVEVGDDGGVEVGELDVGGVGVTELPGKHCE